MQTLPIPIFRPVYRNVDGVEINDVNNRLVNAYLDELGGTTGLPGYSPVITLQSGGVNVTEPVQGIYWWKSKQTLVSVCYGKFFKSTYSTATQTWTTSEITIASGTPSTSGIATFAVGFTTAPTEYLFIATGGNLVYWDGTGSITKAPITGDPNISYVAGIDSYVLAVEDQSNRVWFSTAYNPTTWDALDYFSAIGKEDNLQAIWVKNREIYLLGKETLEVWENDGSTPFSRTPSGFFTDMGCVAPHSVVEVNSLYWVNHRNKIVEFNGARPKEISTPYDKELESAGDLSGCIGDYFKIDGKDFLVFHFPNHFDLVYNLSNQSWSERGQAQTEVTSFTPVDIHNFLYIPEYSKTLVADYSTGKIHEFSKAYHTYDGNDIRIFRRTGHIDYGTDLRKISRRITFKAKRGEVTGDAYIMFRWKDDNKRYSNWKHLSLGNIGETNPIIRLHRTGSYYTRQYEFAITSDLDALFFDAKESFDVCTR